MPQNKEADTPLIYFRSLFKKQIIFVAMAQLERKTRISECPATTKSQTSPTFEQLLKVEEAYWSSTTSPTVRISHDLEDCPSPSLNKKSVLAKVKERAMKLKHSLSGRRKQENDQINGHIAPPWGVTLEDFSDDDDPEYLGAPMYESEAAPEALKETARQHPRAVPVVSESHRVPNRMKPVAATENEKLEPAYAAMSDATKKMASKLEGIAIATQEPEQRAADETRESGQIGDAPSSEARKVNENGGRLSPQVWDKGVTVKEYLWNKLEPGEDERALSQAITEAISPGKGSRDTSVVEKVKAAVSSFFRQQRISNSRAKSTNLLSAASAYSSTQTLIPSVNTHSPKVHHSNSNSSPLIPLSSNPYEVNEEENHGRILQAN